MFKEWYMYFLAIVIVKHFSLSNKLVKISFIFIRLLDGNVAIVFWPGALNVSHGALVPVST